MLTTIILSHSSVCSLLLSTHLKTTVLSESHKTHMWITEAFIRDLDVGQLLRDHN